MSIFDSVMGDMSSFGDAISGIASGSGLLGKGTSPAQESEAAITRNLRMANLLESGKMALPYTQGREFTASKSKPADQVDSDSVNQQWLQRLHRYSTIFTDTSGGKR